MHYESNLALHKNGQGQPRFTICANLVGPKSPMLHTKSQGYWPFGSREEDIKMSLTLYGHGGHLDVKKVKINLGTSFEQTW